MFFRIKKAGGYEYIQLVECKRVSGAVRQTVIASLGRTDHVIASGTLASLLASGNKIIERTQMTTAVSRAARICQRRLELYRLSTAGRLKRRR